MHHGPARFSHQCNPVPALSVPALHPRQHPAPSAPPIPRAASALILVRQISTGQVISPHPSQLSNPPSILQRQQAHRDTAASQRPPRVPRLSLRATLSIRSTTSSASAVLLSALSSKISNMAPASICTSRRRLTSPAGCNAFFVRAQSNSLAPRPPHPGSAPASPLPSTVAPENTPDLRSTRDSGFTTISSGAIRSSTTKPNLHPSASSTAT